MNDLSPFELFCETAGNSWAAISQSRQKAREVREILNKNLSEFQTEDLSVVLFGSLAREEWTSGSDVDWTLLVDGQAAASHYKTAQEIQGKLSELTYEGKKLAEPGTSGVFGTLTFSHDLVHYLGGQPDTNINTTRRVLLARGRRKP